jgi:hypothetical protein
MTAIVIKNFDGLAPKLSPRLLGDAKAQVASNVVLEDGKIVPLKAVSAAVATVAAGTVSIHRWGATASDVNYWLRFSKETSVIQSPVNDDTWSRIYWSTDDGTVVPKYAPSTVAINTSPYPTASYNLGLPAPAATPSVSGTAPSTVATSTWEYILTFTTSGGDSDPSPVGTVTAPTTRTDFATNPISVTGIQVPDTQALYTGKKLWARVLGGATYNLVATLTVTQKEFVDNVTTLGAAYSGTTLSVAQLPKPAQIVASLTAPLSLTPTVTTEYYYTYYRSSYMYQSIGGGVDTPTDVTVPEMVGLLSSVVSNSYDSTQAVTVTIPAAAYTNRPVSGYPVTQYAVFRRRPDDTEPMLIGMVDIPASAITVALVDANRAASTRYSQLAKDSSWTYKPTAATLSATTSSLFTAANKVTYQYTQTFLQGSTESERSLDSDYVTVAEANSVRQQGVNITIDPAPGGMTSKVYRRTVTITPASGATASSITVTNDYKLLVTLDAGVGSYVDNRLNDLATAAIPATSAVTTPAGPTAAPGLAGATAAAPVLESRSYLYTYVTAYGEEGPPSAVSSVVDVDPSATVNLSGLSVSPGANYNVTLKRIYRSVAGTNAAAFLFVAEIPVANTTYADVKAATALGELLPSESWVAPPADLRGLCLGGNGIAAGFTNNATADAGGTLCFSEPYMPHAWPPEYQKSTEFSVVAVIPFGGNAWGVLTTSYPFVAYGNDPAAISLDKMDYPQACVSKKSAVSTGEGVVYASADGLCLLNQNGVKVLTDGLYTRAQWQALSPSTMMSCVYNNMVLVFHSAGTLIFDFTGKGATLTTAAITATDGYYDAVQDTLFLLVGTNIVKWNAGADLTFTWKSKLFESPKPNTFAWAQVLADTYPVTLKLYVDGAQLLNRFGGTALTMTVNSREPIRLPGYSMFRDWEIELSGTNKVNSVVIAESSSELAQL